MVRTGMAFFYHVPLLVTLDVFNVCIAKSTSRVELQEFTPVLSESLHIFLPLFDRALESLEHYQKQSRCICLSFRFISK